MACSISHMHVHFVGFRSAVPDLREKIRTLGAVPVGEGLRAFAGIDSAYSYVGFPTDEGLLVSRWLPSQTLRKMIATAIGIPAWDWVEAGVEKQLIEVAAWRISVAARHEHSQTP